jgi:hypothetical protein
MTEYVPSPLAVFLATLNEPFSSVSSTNPLLAAVLVGSTVTSNLDFDVADPALPVTTAATENRNANTIAMRLISPLPS